MPTFFFNLREGGELLRDEDGVELPDLQTARERSVRIAREIFSADVLDGAASLLSQIDVLDPSSETLVITRFRDVIAIRGI